MWRQGWWLALVAPELAFMRVNNLDELYNQNLTHAVASCRIHPPRHITYIPLKQASGVGYFKKELGTYRE